MILEGDEIFELSDDGEVIIVENPVDTGEGDAGNKKPVDNTNNNGDEEEVFVIEDTDVDDDNKGEENIDPAGTHSDSSSSTLTLQTLISAMRTEGYLPNATEEEIKSISKPSDIAELIKREIETNEYNDLPDDAAQALKAIRNGAKWDEIVAFKKQEAFNNSLEITDIKGDDDSSIENRKAVLAQYYKRTTQFNDAKIDKLIQNFINTGTDESEAIDALKELKELDKTVLEEFNKKQEENAKLAKQKQEERVTTLKKTINETKEIIPGITLNQKQKDSLFKSIVEPVAKTASGIPVNDFTNKYNTDENFRLKVHALTILTNNFSDLGAFEAKTKKSALSKLDAEFQKGHATKMAANNSMYDLKDESKERESLMNFINNAYK